MTDERLYKCQNKLFSLTNLKKQRFLEDVEVCFCESVLCEPRPRIFNNGRNVNEEDLFFQYEEDSKVKYVTSFEKEINKLYVPSPNIVFKKKSKGMCRVCDEAYFDYKWHIELKKHKKNIQDSQFTKYIQEFCQKFGEKPIRKRIKNQFANFSGKNKKIKYEGRGIDGKFIKKK